MQLALNCAWQPLFFNAHRMDWALADILALNAVLAATAWAFHRVEPLAGLLLLPYMAWVAFATYLNYAFLQLNPPVRLRPAVPMMSWVCRRAGVLLVIVGPPQLRVPAAAQTAILVKVDVRLSVAWCVSGPGRRIVVPVCQVRPPAAKYYAQ